MNTMPDSDIHVGNYDVESTRTPAGRRLVNNFLSSSHGGGMHKKNNYSNSMQTIDPISAHSRKYSFHNRTMEIGGLKRAVFGRNGKSMVASTGNNISVKSNKALSF